MKTGRGENNPTLDSNIRKSKKLNFHLKTITLCNSDTDAMEVFGKTMVAVPTNVMYMSSILGKDRPNSVHKCDWKCEDEHVCGNMFRYKVTGLTHICDKTCNPRILYDNNNSLCRVSRKVFSLTAAEVQAVKGVRRKLDKESSSPTKRCVFKHKSGQFHLLLRDPSMLLGPFTVKLVGCGNMFKLVCIY